MLEFRHLTLKDLNNVKKYVTNKNVTRFLTWDLYKDKDKICNYLNYAVKCNSFPDEIMGIIFNNCFIGTVHLLIKNQDNVRIGFGILPDFWNKGLGYKVVQEMIKYIKKSQWSKNTKKISVLIHNDNIYAQKICLKLNFKLGDKNFRENFYEYILIL